MDLRRSPPRSMQERMAGYVPLPRMLDKCRAVLAGTQGEYIYPCPLDRRLLECAGVTAEEFTEAVRDRTDEEVGRWFQARATPHSDTERESWNHMMLTRGPDTEEKGRYCRETLAAIDPTRTDITSWADLLDLEERRSVPLRTPAKAGGPS